MEREMLSAAAIEAGVDASDGRAVMPTAAAITGIMSEAAIELTRTDAQPCRAATLDAFVTAARALKQAEDALVSARQVYAEAVKALSEEAVK